MFHPVAWVATLTLPAYLTAQVAGRMLADRWIERHGPVRIAMVLSTISVVGLILVVMGASISLSLAGFALIGFGVATSFPQAVSAAARLGDRPASENVAALSLLQAIVLFATPPIMGVAASHWGIRGSFALILPFAVLAIVLARNLAERSSPAAAAAA